MRPAILPCASLAAHDEHVHTDGPDNYQYWCRGLEQDWTPLTDEEQAVLLTAIREFEEKHGIPLEGS